MTKEWTYEAIVIGTSAGGLYVLSYLLSAMPEDYPLPVLIVQHRINDDQRDLLEELLQAKCRMSIKQADEKDPIQPGTVYIAPPGYHLLVESDRTLSLSVDEAVRFSRPSIDVLFETAAFVYGKKLVGIILTGANDDGTNGIIAINNAGGMTIAQDPAEAEFPVMPQSAIATSKVKHAWKLSEIRQFLLTIGRS